MIYDKTYLAEKAMTVQKGAQEILDALERENGLSSRSYIIDGILRIEDALGSLHAKARDIMEMCEEKESDYMLRQLGKIEKGK